MPQLQLTIPAQDGKRAGVRIKPREVRAWLEDLPFMDLPRAARLAHEQLRLMNRQVLPAGARLEILGDFLGTYQRLAETLDAGTRDNDELAAQVKRLRQDIGFGYKIVAHELANRRRGFMEGRNLPLALLGAIHTLGLQLLDCYASYRPAPRSLWNECLALYDYARTNGQADYSATLPGFGEQQIDACFRLIALLKLADPYRLPNGMAPALRDYFAQRLDLCQVHAGQTEGGAHLSLKEAFRDAADAPDSHLRLDVDALLERMAEDIAKLVEQGKSRALGLPAEVPAAPLLRSLRQTLDHWRNNPTRGTDREETHTRIDVVVGLDAAYCVLNHGRCFDPSLFLAPGAEHSIDLGAPPAPENDTDASRPDPFACTSLNRSPGGLAVRYRGPQLPHPRVGQLVALHRPASASSTGWVVAACRWLVESEDTAGFDLGLQYLAREPRAVVIRVTDGTGPGTHQAAIAATQKREGQRIQTLITRAGEIRTGSQVVIYEGGEHRSVVCSEQLESSPGFERFIVQPA